MELEQIRRLTIKALKLINDPDRRQLSYLYLKVGELMYVEDPNGGESYHDIGKLHRKMTVLEEEYFYESLNDLVNQGIVAWGQVRSWGKEYQPYYIITSYGKKVLEQDEITPHDMNGYFQHLKMTVPEMDELALRYLHESVECYLSRNFIASSILLGVASEIIFNQLFEVFKHSKINSESKQNEYKNLTDTAKIGRKYKIISNKLQSIKEDLGPEIEENLNIGFEGIFTLIRVQRNELGHPSSIVKRTEINKKIVHAQLIIFVMYCKMVYSIMDKIKTLQ